MVSSPKATGITTFLTSVRVKVLSEVGALLEPLAAHGTRVPAVAAVDPQDVGLDVAVSSEELEADTAGVLVADVEARKLRVVVVFLILVSLEHDASLDGLVAMSARVGGILGQHLIELF
jgi:hypothetical protein